MVNFKGLYFRKVVAGFAWLVAAIDLGVSPSNQIAVIIMLLCCAMFGVCVTRLYLIGPMEKQAYIEWKLMRCRRRINWLDSRCCEYRQQEEDVEEKINQWEELLEQVRKEDE